MPRFPLAPLPRGFHWFRAVGVAVLLGTGLLTSALFLPPHGVEYVVEDGTLTVEAELGLMDLGRSTPLERVGQVQPVDTAGAWRSAGTGMHDLCQGQWHLPGGKPVWMATTCTSPGLLVEVEGEERPWVVTPADPDAFTAALSGGEGGHFAARPGAPEPAAWWLMRVGMPVLMLAVLAVLLRAGRGLRVELRGDRLEVSTGWRTVEVELAGATVRRGLPELGALIVKSVRVGRVMLGRMRGTQGAADMVVTDRDRAVVVQPAEGLPVAVSPVDTDAFVDACVAAGARRG
jgi:hypothetical protein